MNLGTNMFLKQFAINSVAGQTFNYINEALSQQRRKFLFQNNIRIGTVGEEQRISAQPILPLKLTKNGYKRSNSRSAGYKQSGPSKGDRPKNVMQY